MSDQNRLLLAAALMAVVLFVSWQFMGRTQNTSDVQSVPSQPVETSTRVQTSYEEQQVPSEEQTDQADSMATSQADTSLMEERIITVLIMDDGSEIISADISTLGATIVGWELIGYEGIPGADTGEQVDFDGSDWFGGGAAGSFACDSPDTVRVMDAQSTVTLTQSNTGKSVSYTFTPGFYGFTMRRQGFDQLTVLNSGILPVSENNINIADYFEAQWNSEKVKNRDAGDIDMNDQVGNVEWIATRTKYFGIILMPLSFERAYGYVYASGGGEVSPSVGLQDDELMVYAGPLDYGRLRGLGRDTHLMVDFGWPIIRDIGRLLFWFCTSVLSFVSNWGVKIILLSIALKLVLMPLTTKSFRSMAKLKQVQPRMKELQEKYKNDPKALQTAMQKLYREEGVNPLGGCLPLLMQMPVFFALYRVLANSVQLRGAGFVLWIKDLSTPEILIPFENPILGLNGIGLLAVLMGVSMYLQQKMTTVDQSQKSMTYILPVFMTYLFMRFPAGLTLYWFMNNILTIGQQKMISRKLEEEKQA